MAWELYVARGWATLDGVRVRVIAGQRDRDRKLIRVTPVRDPSVYTYPPFGVSEVPESDFEPLADAAEAPEC